MGTILPDNANRAAQLQAEGDPGTAALTKNVDVREVRVGAGGAYVAAEKDSLTGVPISDAGVPRSDIGGNATIAGSVIHDEKKQNPHAQWTNQLDTDEVLTSMAVLFGQETSVEGDSLETASKEEENLYSAEIKDPLQEMFNPKKDPGPLKL